MAVIMVEDSIGDSKDIFNSIVFTYYDEIAAGAGEVAAGQEIGAVGGGDFDLFGTAQEGAAGLIVAAAENFQLGAVLCEGGGEVGCQMETADFDTAAH